MRPQLEPLEDRLAPSSITDALPALARVAQFDAQQAAKMSDQFNIYYGLLLNDLAAGRQTQAIQNATGAMSAFIAEQSLWASGQLAIQGLEWAALVGAATGELDPQAALTVWSYAHQLDAADNAAYARDLHLFNAPFPHGATLPGVPGSTTLALVYPNINDGIGA